MPLGSDVKKGIKPEELEELLGGLEKILDRTKVLYEQYFMGIQKLAPMQLHRDVERKVRELMQQQIRNTALRFRFTTLCQKFGAYNTYWKRTLREIEQGKYVRELKRVKRKADQMGEELPEELLVKLPKLVQDRIRRDRERIVERAHADAEREGQAGSPRETELPDESLALHEISEAEAQTLFNEGDLDLDGLFQALTEAPDGTPVPGASPRGASGVVSAADAAVDALDTDDTIDAPVDDGPEADAWASAPEPEAGARAKAAEPAPDASQPVRTAPPAMAVSLPQAMAASRPAASSAEPVFRVPLPPGTSRRATPPEPPGASAPEPPEPATAELPESEPEASPLAAESTRTRTETIPRVRSARTETIPRVRTVRPESGPLAPEVPPGSPPPAPRTATGPQTPPPPRTATGPQTPPAPRTATGPQMPPAPRTATGPQMPPPPRTATGQTPAPRSATAPPTPPPTPRAATAPPARAATAPPAPPRAATAHPASPRAATAHPAPPPTPRTATGPRAASVRGAEPATQDLPPGMDDRQCRELYARYLKARQLVGESNDDVTYERLVNSLSKQASAIMTQHSARGVQFHVVVRGDRVVLKAKPLKPGKGE